MAVPYPYQLIIIGSGPGGTYGAIRAAQLKMKVALIEKDNVGGVCLNKGCIPSKTLLRSAQLFELMNESKSFGIRCEKIVLDYALVLDRSLKVMERMSKNLEFLFKKNKIDIFKGRAHLMEPHRVLVEPSTQLTADRILIAAGSSVKEVPGFKVDGQFIVTSDEALTQNQVPKSVLVIGGGVLGVEFAYLYRAFGAEVTLLEAKERLLPSFDAEIGQELERALKKKGINVLCKTRALRSRVERSLVRVVYEDRQHAEKELYASQVLVGTGRQPVSDGLGLETLGVQIDQGYVKVGKNFQTSVPSVYAIGDIIGAPLLAHAASEQGKVVVEMMAGLRELGIDSNQIPSCVYSHPEVASVGFSEEEAKNAGHSIKVGKFPFRALGRALVDGNEDGFVKVVVDGKTGKLLGGQIIGDGATELIAQLTLIKSSGLSVEDVASVVHAYPTLSEAVLEALLASQKRSFYI